MNKNPTVATAIHEDPHAITSDVRDHVANTRTAVSVIDRNVLTRPKGTRGQEKMASADRNPLSPDGHLTPPRPTPNLRMGPVSKL